MDIANCGSGWSVLARVIDKPANCSDYTALVSILPSNSPLRVSAQRSLAQLPARIAAQQDKEKDEMLGKLKDLGNGLLGKFGLSTDMFKFDEQPGGGYNLRFEK